MAESLKGKSEGLARKRVRRPPQLSRGMPAQDSVKEIVDFVSPQGVKHKILKTTEMDEYDPPPKVPKKLTS
jgi:hypothetical protein